METEELPGLEEKPFTKQPLYRRERHLASAIIVSEVEYTLTHRDNPRALRPYQQRLLEDVAELTVLPPQQFLSWCVSDLARWLDKKRERKDLLNRAEVVANSGHDEAYEHFYRMRPCMTRRPLPLDSVYVRLASVMDDVISEVSLSFEARQRVQIGDVCVIFDAELCYIKVTTQTCYLIPYSLFLCLTDMCAAWSSAVLYSHMSDSKYPGESFHRQVELHIALLLEVLREHGQATYKLCKMWPSFVIGAILRDLEESPGFLRTISEDVPWYLRQTSLYRALTGPITCPQDAMLKLELAGLWKTMGHPVVNMDKSTSSWCSKGTVMKLGLRESAKNINNMFKKEFCRQYYKTHKKWPNLEMDPDTDPALRQCYLENEWGESRTHKWDPQLFEHIEFKKNFEFNFHIDTIDIIADKAIIPRKGEWIYEYDSKAFRTQHGHFSSGPEPTTKSVVMHYLTTEIFNCEEIIRLVDKGVIPSDWRVMVAVPKEREFKEEDARCYGKMTPEMRAYQVVTEKNIADVIFRYIKHQSMTLSEDQLLKTLFRMSHPGEDHDYVNIIIDFSSWCTHFRAELLAPLFHSLDRLFGFQQVYGFTHMFPLLSYLLFQDRYNPPAQDANGDPMDGPRCVIGPESWLEGLRQKGWTMATILIILIAAYKCDTTASLLGQGDNQVIVLRIPSARYLEERGLTSDLYTDQFLQVLGQVCEESGIVIKIPESWRSRRLLEYGRRYYVDGVMVSSALKKATRLTSEANQAVVTLNTIISGLFSSGASITGDDTSPSPAYRLTLFEAALALWKRHPSFETMSDEWMTVLLLMNRSVGGYPTVLFPQFALRATQDTLSLGLSVLKHLLSKTQYRDMVHFLLDIKKNRSTWITCSL